MPRKVSQVPGRYHEGARQEPGGTRRRHLQDQLAAGSAAVHRREPHRQGPVAAGRICTVQAAILAPEPTDHRRARRVDPQRHQHLGLGRRQETLDAADLGAQEGSRALRLRCRRRDRAQLRCGRHYHRDQD